MSYSKERDAQIGRPAENTFVQYARENGWRVVPHQWNKGNGAALGLRPTDWSDEVPHPYIDRGRAFRLPDFDIFRNGVRYSVEVKAKSTYGGYFLLDIPIFHHLVEVWRTSGTPVLLCIYNQHVAPVEDQNPDALIAASVGRLNGLDPLNQLAPAAETVRFPTSVFRPASEILSGGSDVSIIPTPIIIRPLKGHSCGLETSAV